MRPASRRAATVLLVCAAALAAAAAALDGLGRSRRRYAPGHAVVEVKDGAGALAAWRAAGVRGRVLLFLGRTLPLAAPGEAGVRAFLADPVAGAASVPSLEDSFVYLAMRENLVRRVVYLVPDDRWPAFAEHARANPEQHADGDGFVWLPEGLPIVSIPARARRPVLEERPLVYATGDTAAAFGAALAAELEADPRADLVVVRR